MLTSKHSLGKARDIWHAFARRRNAGGPVSLHSALEVAYHTAANHPQHGIHVVKGTRQRISGVKIHEVVST